MSRSVGVGYVRRSAHLGFTLLDQCSAGSAVSTEEFLSVRRALVESQVKIQQLVRVKEDLERHMTNMHSQVLSPFTVFLSVLICPTLLLF